MASTRTLGNVVAWAQTFIGLRPLSGVGGIPGEPAVTIANNVLSFILGPPFAWRWNRNSASFATTIAAGSTYNQSYQQSVPDFGWMEKAYVTDSSVNTTWPLEVRLLLDDAAGIPGAADVGRPEHISAELDDDSGNITFKLFPIPDKVYTIKAVYQKKPTLFTGLAGKWAPIPDEDQYIYSSGFLAQVFENMDDSRFVPEYQKFLRQVIAKAEGLTDSQKNIFLSEKLVGMRQMQDASMGVTQGRQARGV